MRCFNCNEIGHVAKKCPTLKCYLCQQLGHFQTDCPQRNGFKKKNKQNDLENQHKQEIGNSEHEQETIIANDKIIVKLLLFIISLLSIIAKRMVSTDVSTIVEDSDSEHADLPKRGKKRQRRDIVNSQT